MKKVFNETFSYKLIYVFGIDSNAHKGLLKIGDTTISDVEEEDLVNLIDNHEVLNNAAHKRIKSYTKTAGIKYKLFHTSLAIKKSGDVFRDYDVHKVLQRSKIKKSSKKLNGANEWFYVDLVTVKKAIAAVKDGKESLYPSDITKDQTPIIFRPEQEEAISKTIKRFTNKGVEINDRCHMLWNAKMRFGKTLCAFEVVKRMKFDKTLIITHRPAVRDGWYKEFDKIFIGEDKNKYLYGSKKAGESFEKLMDLNKKAKKSFIYFASIQDLRESSLVGGLYNKNEEVFQAEWDFVIVDEAHEGTQTKLGELVLSKLIRSSDKTKTLYLSGTPFNLLSPESSVEFSEEEVFTWDYVMEQTAKLEWVSKRFGDANPYESLPKMNIYTYDLAGIIKGRNYSDVLDSFFSFREFFKVWTPKRRKLIPEYRKRKDLDGKFVYEKDIRFFLDLLVSNENKTYPFSLEKYRRNFRHTLWMLPGVKEARALSSLLKKHPVFKNFEIVNVAGEGDEEVPLNDALEMVNKAITNKPEETWTITLSCGRLTTGVTVPAWTAVLMLSGSAETSASSYLQTIFRVQTPASISNKTKENCYVFDFAPDRVLKIIAEMGEIAKMNNESSDNRMVISNFTNFCPVIGISGSGMKEYNVNDIVFYIKQVAIDSVVKNGFADSRLYNNNKLFNLSDIELEKFRRLRATFKKNKLNNKTREIIINEHGLAEEESSVLLRNKKEISNEEKERLKELRKKQAERNNAIRILSAIAIRIPLLIYGADVSSDKRIDVNNFTKLIDQKSWEEFMPKGVTKDIFNDFKEYFDNDVFVAAGIKIRKKAKVIDNYPPLERVQALSKIFATFRNPDKETVLTPWKTVNMHLGECIGGANFYTKDYEDQVVIDENESARWVEKENITNKVFNPDAKILEINSKSGLYPLYATASVYLNILNKGVRKNTETLWEEILENNIYIICRTEMAASITRRTLRGYKDYKTNIIIIDDIVEKMKDQYKSNYFDLVNTIISERTWKKGRKVMKFDAVIGNPPYQKGNEQIYTDFYLLSKELGKVVTLIFPTGWQEPKISNNLAKLNNLEVKSDNQIVFIDNRENVFPGIKAVEWTNFILWKKGYNNGLNGKQLLYVNGKNQKKVKLPIDQKEIKKPKEIVDLVEIVRKKEGFISLKDITSAAKPYGLRADVISRPNFYNLPALNEKKENDDDIVVIGNLNRKRVKKYIPKDYPLPKRTKTINKYKLFIPKAWGNMNEKIYRGGLMLI